MKKGGDSFLKKKQLTIAISDCHQQWGDGWY